MALSLEIPRAWRAPVAVAGVIGMLVAGTITSLSRADAAVRMIAKDEASKTVAPVSAEMASQKQLEDLRRQYLEQRLDAIELKLDKVIEHIEHHGPPVR